MKYFLIKTYRDIARNWIQFLAVFLMALLSVAIYSGMEGVWHGLDKVSNLYYDRTNIADFWVYATNASEDDIQDIASLSGFEAEASMAVNVSSADANDGGSRSFLKLRTLADGASLSKFLLQEGGEFSSSANSGVWLDLSYAEARGIRVSDEVQLSFMGQEKTFKVQGLVLGSEYIYYTGSTTEIVPNHELYGYCFISEQSAQEFFGRLAYNEIRVKSTSANPDMINDQIKAILGDAYLDTVFKEDVPAVSQVTKEVSQMQIMAQMFSFVFILLALLSMYTTMSRLIDTQRTEIGLLKALGFCNWSLRLHYAAYGLIVSATGGLAGALVGPLVVSPAVMKIKKATLVLPYWEIQTSFITYALVGVIVVCCVLSCAIAAQRSLKEVPAVSMRNKVPKAGKMSLFERIPFLWNIFSSEWKWIFRDISRAKLRTAIGVVGVAGGLTLIVAGFGFSDSISNSNDYVYHFQDGYQYKLLLNDAVSPEDASAIDERSSSSQWIMEKSANFNKNGVGKKGLLSIIDQGGLLLFEDTERNSIELADSGAFITRKLANKIGVEIGDSIQVHAIGSQDFYEMRIENIAYSPSPQGIFVTKAYFESVGGAFAPTSALVEGGDNYADISAVKESVTIGMQEENMNTMSKSVMTIIRLLILASVLLSIVIIYNLGTLSFVERYREYATMKVLGFYQNEIRALMLRENTLILVVGLALGTPISIKFLKEYIGIVAFDSFEWIAQINNASFMLCAGIIIVCSVVVALASSRKVRKIIMVEALKSID
ncbi:MAG: ABC transporter permease [Clostridiales bacterium]|jgi:putative ABC transport system permease protein|nr:ABC transporter permease [Clostridiales bacterium]